MTTTKVTSIERGFNYRTLESGDCSFVKDRAVRIHDLARKTAEAIRLIGQWLTEVKERLPHGAWESWLHSEFAWTDRTAQRLMQVYEAFKSDNLSDLSIDVSALYLIAAPKTPEPVRQEIIYRAQTGEHITHAKAVRVRVSYEEHEVYIPPVARQIATTALTQVATPSTATSTTPKHVLRVDQCDQCNRVKALVKELRREITRRRNENDLIKLVDYVEQQLDLIAGDPAKAAPSQQQRYKLPQQSDRPQ